MPDSHFPDHSVSESGSRTFWADSDVSADTAVNQMIIFKSSVD